MTRQSNPRRAIIAYEVLPNIGTRFKLAISRVRSAHEEALGFQGVFRILGHRKRVVFSRSNSTVTESSVKAIAIFKFSPDIYLLVADVETSAPLQFWKKLMNPKLMGFPEDLFKTSKAKVKFLKSPSAHLYLINENQQQVQEPAIRVTSEFVAVELATRIVATEAVERALSARLQSLSSRNMSLFKVNSIAHSSAQWHDAWIGTGDNVPGLIEEYRAEQSFRLNLQKHRESLTIAINREQRRIAWASGSAVAIGNLIAATIPDESFKWIAWPASVLIFATMFWTRPFSRI